MSLWELEERANREAVFIMNLWNKCIAVPYKKKKVKLMTLQRRSKLCELSAYFNLSDVRSVIKEIKKSEWLLSKSWLTLDWVLDVEHLTKILEGSYVNTYSQRTNQYVGTSHIESERIEL
jgi:hypothetical protein